MDSKDEPTAHPITTPRICVESSSLAAMDTASSHIQSLERELAMLTRLKDDTQEALKEALELTAGLRNQNAKISKALVAANAENVRLSQMIGTEKRSNAEASAKGERFICAYLLLF